MKDLTTDKLDTMEENENEPVFEQKTGLEKNLIVPMLVVIILTGLAVWLVPSDDTEDAKKPLPKLDSVIQPLDTSLPVIRPLDEEGSAVSDEVADNDQEADSGQEADNGQEADTQPDGTISRPAATDGGDVRSLIAQLRDEGDDSGRKAFEEAEMRRKMGDNENAYLLYFLAAKHGHAKAAVVLGTMADPIYYTSVTSALDAPDPDQAVKWYKMAIAAGDNDAKQKLADLAKRIKKQADDGSSEAQRLMLQLR